MKKLSIFALCCTLIHVNVLAQELRSPTNTFSHQKVAYITLVDGTEMEGTIDDVDRKKGLIEFIKIIDAAGKEYDLKPEQVQHMYLPPTDLDKVQKTATLISDTQKWNDEKLNQDFLNQGYAYFELGEVKLKKENKHLLMQLLNPSFSKEIKVFYDPFAGETSSLGFGGLKLVGGIAKSYYVSNGVDMAFKLSKKNYDKEFKTFFENCGLLEEKYPDPKWRDLADHVITFSECREQNKGF